MLNLKDALARKPANLETMLAAHAAAGQTEATRWEAEVRMLLSLAGWLATPPLASTRHWQRILDLLGPYGL